MPAPTDPRSPVTPDDLDLVVRLSVEVLRAVPQTAWDEQAGTLEWSRWETVEHLGDDFFAYAVQMGPSTPPLTGHVPFTATRRRAGGPANSVHAERDSGPAGLLQTLEANGALLSAMVRMKPPHTRAYHVYGVSDPEGFAAMGIVEALVHTHDLIQGLDLPWNPPADLCARVLTRLFPEAPTDTEPWTTLLWATGRADLPGRPALTKWRWDGTPRD
ncbi:hypothetical protein ACIBCD_38495 [Nocardia brasiliensis]|uniref:hypothetical protein n=1 Tax=Nocardia brasiliensis TaxID=37326 RepID=UPI0037ABC531